MITREEAVNAVELMVLLRGRHEQAFDERAAVDLERWEALRESHGDRRAAGIIAISPRVAELNRAYDEAFVELGRALVELQVMVRATQRNVDDDTATASGSDIPHRLGAVP